MLMAKTMARPPISPFGREKLSAFLKKKSGFSLYDASGGTIDQSRVGRAMVIRFISTKWRGINGKAIEKLRLNRSRVRPSIILLKNMQVTISSPKMI